MKTNYLKKDGHLDDVASALCADAMKLGKEKALPQEIRDHLSTCDTCKIDVVNLLSEMDSLDITPGESLVPHEAPENEQGAGKSINKWSTMILPWAAILIAGAILTTLYLMKPDPERASVYRINPEMESLIDETYRGPLTKIVSPAINSVAAKPISFEWKTEAEPPFILKILNNRGDIVFHGTAHVNHLKVSKNLQPGLYYWKLEDEKDLLLTGKFNVEIH